MQEPRKPHRSGKGPRHNERPSRPELQQCDPIQTDPITQLNPSCSDGRVCQIVDNGRGICRRGATQGERPINRPQRCDLASQSCPSGQECQPMGNSQRVGVCRDSSVAQAPINCNPAANTAANPACPDGGQCRYDAGLRGFFCVADPNQGAGFPDGGLDLSRLISSNQPQCPTGSQAIVDLYGNQQRCWSNSYCTASGSQCMGMSNTDAGICCRWSNNQPSASSWAGRQWP